MKSNLMLLCLFPLLNISCQSGDDDKNNSEFIPEVTLNLRGVDFQFETNEVKGFGREACYLYLISYWYEPLDKKCTKIDSSSRFIESEEPGILVEWTLTSEQGVFEAVGEGTGYFVEHEGTKLYCSYYDGKIVSEGINNGYLFYFLTRNPVETVEDIVDNELVFLGSGGNCPPN